MASEDCPLPKLVIEDGTKVMIPVAVRKLGEKIRHVSDEYFDQLVMLKAEALDLFQCQGFG